MSKNIEATLKPGDRLTVADRKGNEIIVIDFDNDPGAFLVQISVYDTDGQPISTLGIDYLGAGYPQCAPPGAQHFVNQVLRSSL